MMCLKLGPPAFYNQTKMTHDTTIERPVMKGQLGLVLLCTCKGKSSFFHSLTTIAQNGHMTQSAAFNEGGFDVGHLKNPAAAIFFPLW
jgi:hypothetical protein